MERIILRIQDARKAEAVRELFRNMEGVEVETNPADRESDWPSHIRPGDPTAPGLKGLAGIGKGKGLPTAQELREQTWGKKRRKK